MAEQRGLFDVCSNRHGGNPESVEANESIAGEKYQLRERVLAFIKGRGDVGATCDEMEQELGLRLHTISARCTELLKSERVTRSGVRKTRSGRNASVLVAL